MVWFNPVLALVFLGLFAAGWLYFRLAAADRDAAPADAMLAGIH